MSMTFFQPILRPLQKMKKHFHFMQDGATAYTANYYVLNEVFEDRLISHRLWPVRSSHLNSCDLYLWGNIKDNVFK
jgi:hypothetical protein